MMEQIYRRRTSRASQPAHTKKAVNYKKTRIRQSVFCLMVFIFCLLVKVMPEPSLLPVKRSIGFIVEHTTDFKALPQKIGTLIHSIVGGDAPPEDDNTVLTKLQNPVIAPVTSPFGLRDDPVDGEEAFHYGIDLGAPAGEKIKCAASGTAEEVGTSSEYGNYALIRHSDTVYTLYAHCDRVLPVAGDTVTAGQVIATVGDTGRATAPHLHFEIRDGETWLDPARFLDFGQEAAGHD